LKNYITQNDIKSEEFKREDTSVKSFSNLPAKTICVLINALTM